MPLYLLNVCRETAGQDYQALGTLMRSVGALEVLPDTWATLIDLSAMQLERALEAALGRNDRFLVTEIGPTWVAGRIKPSTAAWLKALRP